MHIQDRTLEELNAIKGSSSLSSSTNSETCKNIYKARIIKLAIQGRALVEMQAI